jgi:8-oxo-dGTP diphosphatase
MSGIKGPALTVDAVIEYPDGRVVLIKRGNPPFKGSWALPGGFVDIGETVDKACVREAREECSIEIELSGILGVYSDPERDPRGHTVSIVFRADYKSGKLIGADDASEAKLFSRDELKDLILAFDHREVLIDAGWIVNGM